MAFDGIVTAGLIKELNNMIKGGRIEKIYQPFNDELFIQINANRMKHILFISSNSSNPRIYLTEEKSQNPISPPSFCMLLRKHLVGSKISEIRQHSSDRVIEFQIMGFDELSFDEPKKLIVEIMGKHSNIILVDGVSGMVLGSIKHVSVDMSRERQILPKLEYLYPPSHNKISFFSNIEDNEFDIEKIQGLGKTIKSELYNSTDSRFRLMQIVNCIETGKLCPIIYYDETGKAVEFYVFPLEDYSGTEYKTFQSISEMLDYYYSQKDSCNRIRQKSADLMKVVNQKINKNNLKKQRLLEDLEEAKMGETYRLYGELITANIHNLKKGQKNVVLSDYYTGNDINIVLNPLLSPSENAQMYYKKYNKTKTMKEEKAAQLKDTDDNIHVLESYSAFIKNAESPEDIDEIRNELIEQGYLKKRKKKEVFKSNRSPFMQFTIFGDFSVLVGKNNRENDELTMKKANAKDIWFHTKDIPGSHVILFTNGREPGEKTILEAASIAAFYSKASESQNVPVDYTPVKNIKKIPGARPGMVIFKDYKTVYVNPKKPG